ncbi:MAG TPA: hypothetical protein VFC33_15920 [Acidimicrobiia bacterium]|nr:hypothetical protein [Acidimicrobiia bacterium]
MSTRRSRRRSRRARLATGDRIFLGSALAAIFALVALGAVLTWRAGDHGGVQVSGERVAREPSTTTAPSTPPTSRPLAQAVPAPASFAADASPPNPDAALPFLAAIAARHTILRTQRTSVTTVASGRPAVITTTPASAPPSTTTTTAPPTTTTTALTTTTTTAPPTTTTTAPPPTTSTSTTSTTVPTGAP